MNKIKVYGTPGCSHCQSAKKYLDGKKIEYEYIDVNSDQESRKEIMKLGARSVPVITINDNVIIGFNSDKIDEALKT